jgi:hypothetical protein
MRRFHFSVAILALLASPLAAQVTTIVELGPSGRSK